MRRAVLLALGFVMATAVSYGQSITLDFNAPVPGTLTDANGLGTGFTTRLPGSGASIAPNDPYLNLTGGRLNLTATHSSLNQTGGLQLNLGIMDIVTVPISTNAVGQITVYMRIRNVTFLGAHEQAGLIIGTSTSNSLRLHVGEGGYIQLNENTTATGLTDLRHYLSPPSSIAPGHDIEFTMVGIGNSWNSTWYVPNTGASGSSGVLTFPWLVPPTGLFVGVTAQSPNGTPFIAEIDDFHLNAPFSAIGGGQANSATARLEINGVAIGTQPGPFVVNTAPLQPLTFFWQGAPLMPMILISGPLRPTPYAVPGIGGLPGLGLVHLGFSPTYSDITIVFDGAHMSGGLQLTTSPTGTASQTVIVPAGTPPGTQIAVQGIVEQVAGTTTYGNLLTAAFRIDVL